jgi:hypothetical protein
VALCVSINEMEGAAERSIVSALWRGKLGFGSLADGNAQNKHTTHSVILTPA